VHDPDNQFFFNNDGREQERGVRHCACSHKELATNSYVQSPKKLLEAKQEAANAH
jgi:hypothetical protein